VPLKSLEPENFALRGLRYIPRQPGFVLTQHVNAHEIHVAGQADIHMSPTWADGTLSYAVRRAREQSSAR
jgi:hypothetical protein